MELVEQYELVKSEGVCPDCGNDVKKMFMQDIPSAAPQKADDPIWTAEDVGYACTVCTYFINAEEKAA